VARLEAGESVAIGGAESYATFCARVDAALARLRDALDPGEHALVVSHGGVIGALVSGVLGLRDEAALPLGVVEHTSLTSLSLEVTGRVALHVFNDASHLAETDASALVLVAAPASTVARGAFVAIYDADDEDDGLDAIAARLRSRHPTGAVAVCAAPSRVHRWVRALLGGRSVDDPSALADAVAGTSARIGTIEGRLALLDYGVACDVSAD